VTVQEQVQKSRRDQGLEGDHVTDPRFLDALAREIVRGGDA
jgi:hypothetical protein